MNLREQFVNYLKANIESPLLVDINNNHENYINWLETKVIELEKKTTSTKKKNKKLATVK